MDAGVHMLFGAVVLLVVAWAHREAAAVGSLAGAEEPDVAFTPPTR